MEDYKEFHREEEKDGLGRLQAEAEEIFEEFGLEDEIEKFKNSKKTRSLLDGCKFSFRLQEMRFQLFSDRNKITRNRVS